MGLPVHATPATPGATHQALAATEVVVGYDGTVPSEDAVRWAATEAERLGSPLTVLYAADVPPGRAWPLRGLDTARDLGAVSTRMAQKGATFARSEHPDLRVGSTGVVGVAAAELIARSATAGLVVVGGRRHAARHAGGVGPVSFAVTMHSRCPVVVVPEGAVRHPGAAAPVVVGVDGSRAADTALELAVRLAEAWGAPLQVVSAWQRPSAEPWSLAFDGGEALDQVATLAADAAAEDVERAVQATRHASPGLDVSGSAVEGLPADVLADASERAGLVVVGSRGHGGFAGLVLGSVSHALVRRASGPVAVVRHGSF
jgi:nucleotide-binding universal stress UspA family protein